MSKMFLYCLELTSLPDLTKWYIGDNTDIKDIFEKCPKLTNKPILQRNIR